MNRLTTDNPTNNIETLHNYCYGKDGRCTLRYADGKEDVDLCEYAAQLCHERNGECGIELSADEIMEDGLMDCPDCPVAIMYYLGIQATHLRGRLKEYEDAKEIDAK